MDSSQWQDSTDAPQFGDRHTDVVAERGTFDAWSADAWWDNQWRGDVATEGVAADAWRADSWGQIPWPAALMDRPSGSDAVQLPDRRTDIVAERSSDDAWWANAWWESQGTYARWDDPSASDALQLADRRTDNAQGAAGSADSSGVTARLMPQDVIRIQQAEAALGPPRSLHNLARDALNDIAKRPTQETVDLDTVFPWVPYVAAHKENEAIIGTGITHARAVFFQAPMTPIVVARNVWTSASTERMALSVEFTLAIHARMTLSCSSAVNSESTCKSAMVFTLL